jgi:uncharacterized protein with PQ loop repeat
MSQASTDDPITAVHPGGRDAYDRKQGPPPGGLGKILRVFSVATMLMTLPQVVTVWGGQGPAGVSLPTWLTYLLSAILWLIYGLKRRDKTIYLACIGWILLDAAIVVGVLVHR